MILLKNYWPYLFTVIILFCFFKNNTKDGIPYDYVSESLVVGRMMESERTGLLSYSGLPGMMTDLSNDEGFKLNSLKQYYLLENTDKRKNFKDFQTYNSQTGGQGLLYSTFNKISPFNLITNIEILKNFTLLINAIMFSIFIGWCKRNFGIIPAITVLLFIAVSSWIWLFADSLWWCLWSFYLPFITMLLGLELLKENTNKILLIVLFSGLTKCFFTGFEYISTTLLAVFAPIVFYYIKDSRKIKDFLLFSTKTAFILLVSVVLEMLVLIFQLKNLKGSYTEGIRHIVDSYNIRTAAVIIEGKTAAISNNMYVQIIIRYLSGDVFSWLKPNIPFILLIFLIFISSLILIKMDYKKYKPIVFSTWFSIIAPLSWFVLFIQHSNIHSHLNFIVWYIPFLPLGILCFGILINVFIERFTKSVL
ncbi:hypothetical protein [Flavobacterium limnosediminis]|uniref:hypothetical protein n=1 Tax=Flavobacterium limnosediminis TaxID=1401027 RepID=UPI000411C2BC|nr:hypothetical protein [Flavobacterium limnosediminis]